MFRVYARVRWIFNRKNFSPGTFLLTKIRKFSDRVTPRRLSCWFLYTVRAPSFMQHHKHSSWSPLITRPRNPAFAVPENNVLFPSTRTKRLDGDRSHDPPRPTWSSSSLSLHTHAAVATREFSSGARLHSRWRSSQDRRETRNIFTFLLSQHYGS